VEFNGFIYVDDDVIFVPEVTGESGDDITLVDEEDDDDDESAITVMQASSMAWLLWGFVMTKSDVSDHVSESAEILQEFAKKSLPQWALQKELPTCTWSKHGSFVYALFQASAAK